VQQYFTSGPKQAILHCGTGWQGQYGTVETQAV